MMNCDEPERRQTARRAGFNGLDYVEVSDDCRELYLYFLDRVPTREELREENVRIEGGVQITGIRVVNVEPTPGRDGEDGYVTVRVDKPGDYSIYTLRLVDLPSSLKFDPRYLTLDVNFHIDEPSDLDCKVAPEYAPELYDAPELDYLAKDYQGFRQLILDRLSLIMPAWRERHVPDIGIALVEILAYTGDHLSYYQDAVATEAYIATARQRISVRRHARLVDYTMHEGYNARAWLHLRYDGGASTTFIPGAVYFTTPIAGVGGEGAIIPADALAGIDPDAYEVFEPMLGDHKTLYAAQNEMHLYTWGNFECCLPKGATRATLIDIAAPPPVLNRPDAPPPTPPAAVGTPYMASAAAPSASSSQLNLHAGDFILFEEVIGPDTANPADANPRKRHVVRLVSEPRPDIDPVTGQAVLEIEWHHEDALPFDLCISTTGPAPDCARLENVSVARGNLILVDHGRRIADEPLGSPRLKDIDDYCEGDDCAGEPYPVGQTFIPHKFRPHLKETRLVFHQPLNGDASAARILHQDAQRAVPAITLTSRYDEDAARYALQPFMQPDALESVLSAFRTRGEVTMTWAIQPDLLNSAYTSGHFVVEMDDAGFAHLRFGEGDLGRQPQVGEQFTATYRVSNVLSGNVGAGAITQIVTRPGFTLSDPGLSARNPLPAAPAVAPETTEEVRLTAPFVYGAESQLQRAVTADDYAMLVGRDFTTRVQRAAATLRWNGSWFEVLVVIDPVSGIDRDDEAALLREVETALNRYRRIGHDLVVERAQYVGLDIWLEVCVAAGYAQGDVKGALLRALGSGALPGDKRAFFHPDNLTFGGPVAVSRLVTAAHAVRGVESVTVKTFKRLENVYQPDVPESGILTFGALEIPRLDNDPNARENGVLKITLKGGRS